MPGHFLAVLPIVTLERQSKNGSFLEQMSCSLGGYAQVGGLDRKKLGLYVIRTSISQSRAIITAKTSIQIINIPWKASSRGTNDQHCLSGGGLPAPVSWIR